MKRPYVAVLPLYDRDKESYWMLPGYMKGIEQAGGVPVMMPLTTDAGILDVLAERYDAFLFTGGQDVDPALYGECRSPLCGETCGERDGMESYLLPRVIGMDKPVLGICRGLQLLNAVLGGTLYQDLPAEHPSAVEHHQMPPYDKPVHRVHIEAGSPLFSLLEKETMEVNSYHHQAIKTLANRLTPMARSEDGLVEAVCMAGRRFVWAVQWHPEFCYQTDENNRRILHEFVAPAAGR